MCVCVCVCVCVCAAALGSEIKRPYLACDKDEVRIVVRVVVGVWYAWVERVRLAHKRGSSVSSLT